MGAIEEINIKLKAIDRKLANSNRFRFQKLSKFCDQQGMDPKTVKKYFPDAIHKKGIYWVDLDRISQEIENTK